MRTAIRVNRSPRDRGGKDTVSRKHRIEQHKMTEHVDALTRTLAPESRHIVASFLSGTTSRAVVLSLYVVSIKPKRSGALSAPGEG